jgi:hypothetical protein
MFGSDTLTLSKHFTYLVGREVKFTKTPPAPDSGKRWVYASYDVVPADDPTAMKSLVVKADLELLGSLAGSLVGLPNDEVERHLRSKTLEELMRDAIYEILNVASGVIASDSRVVLTGVAMNSNDVKGGAAQVLASPSLKVEFNVVVQGYNGGRFIVLG